MYRITVMREKDWRQVVQFPEAPIGVPATVPPGPDRREAQQSHVKAGENAGRDLMTYNVARPLQKVGMRERPRDRDRAQAGSGGQGQSARRRPSSRIRAEHGPIIAAAVFNFAKAPGSRSLTGDRYWLRPLSKALPSPAPRSYGPAHHDRCSLCQAPELERLLVDPARPPARGGFRRHLDRPVRDHHPIRCRQAERSRPCC